MDRSDQAAKYMQDGYNCAQAVILAFADALGMDAETAVRVSAGFGGGLGRSGNVCGAVSGAVMALSLKYGSTDPQDKEAKEITYAHTRSFVERFQNRYGSLTCPGLLGYDIGNPAEYQKARELGLFQSRCTLHVRSAAQIAGEIMEG